MREREELVRAKEKAAILGGHAISWANEGCEARAGLFAKHAARIWRQAEKNYLLLWEPDGVLEPK